jgi:hypothetical protein
VEALSGEPGMHMADEYDPWEVWLDEHGPALLLFARQWVPSRADAELKSKLSHNRKSVSLIVGQGKKE